MIKKEFHFLNSILNFFEVSQSSYKSYGRIFFWFIRDAIELQSRISVFQCSILQWCAVGYNTEQISSDKREALENDSFHWEVGPAPNYFCIYSAIIMITIECKNLKIIQNVHAVKPKWKAVSFVFTKGQ